MSHLFALLTPDPAVHLSLGHIRFPLKPAAASSWPWSSWLCSAMGEVKGLSFMTLGGGAGGEKEGMGWGRHEGQ